jgi:hypothetical protein
MAQALKLKTLAAVTVVTAGTPVRVSLTSIMVYEVLITSVSTNTGIQAVGDEDVDASTNRGGLIEPNNHLELAPPDSARGYDQIDLKDVYLDSTTNGAIFTILAWVRG